MLMLGATGVSIAAPGDLDYSFGTNGAVSIRVNDDPMEGGNARRVAVQQDGKIVLAGNVGDAFGMVRYNANGTLDTGFGSGGKVVSRVGSFRDILAALAIQRDGKILLAGSNESRDKNFNDTTSFFIERYDSNGRIDPSLGSGGLVLTSFGEEGSAYAADMAIQPDGKIVLGGVSVTGPTQSYNSTLALARYNSDGSADNSFNGNGRVTTSLPYIIVGCSSLALQSDGKIVVAGFSSTISGALVWALVRYNPDGTLDPGFGTGGKRVWGAGSGVNEPAKVIIQADGKILVAGSSSTPQFLIFRFNADGTPDSSFGAAGRIHVKIAPQFSECTSLLLQPNGKIVAGGHAAFADGLYRFALARYQSNGLLDTTFSGDGIVITKAGDDHSQLYDLALQPDGKILAAGTVYQRPFFGFGLVRYEGDTPPAITSQPVSQTVTVGSNASFNVTAEGTPPLRYQWRHGVTNLLGATNSSLLLSNVQFVSTGHYTVVVANDSGSVTSSVAILSVNRVPAANPQSVRLDEDTPMLITLTGFDPDADPLSFMVVNGPTNGNLSGDLPNGIYKPNLNYFGPDGFQFRVYDGRVQSPVATVTITVLPVNDPPVAYPQSLTVDEDTPLPIALTASDVDGDALTYSITSPPAHGTLTGTPPNFIYLAATNHFGPDSFTFKVNDGQLDSTPATVSLTVLPVNDAPDPKIVISPLTQLPGLSNLVVVAPVCSNAWVILDGSQSSDIENEPLQFTWTEGTNTLGTTATVTNQFTPGRHTITLLVSDGHDSATATTAFHVLSPAEAVNTLAQVVEPADLGGRNPQPLLANLRAAAASFERCNLTAGLNQLKALQNKVSVQIAPQNPALAALLIGTAQEIMDILTGTGPARYETTFSEVMQRGNGKLKLKFAGPKSRTCFVEASTNLIHWQQIGVAETLGDGTFRFEDPAVGRYANRFYRIVAP